MATTSFNARRPRPTVAVPPSPGGRSIQQHRTQQQSHVLRLLAQICARAEQLRAPGDAVAPVSLLQLLEAADAVFERRRASPLDAAECRRLLLVVALDPEPDWRLKLRRLEESGHTRVLSTRVSIPTAAASGAHRNGKNESAMELQRRQRTQTTRRPEANATGRMDEQLAERPSLRASRAAARVAPVAQLHEWQRDLFSDMLFYDRDRSGQWPSDDSSNRPSKALKHNATRGVSSATFQTERSTRTRHESSPRSLSSAASAVSLAASRHSIRSGDGRADEIAGRQTHRAALATESFERNADSDDSGRVMTYRGSRSTGARHRRSDAERTRLSVVDDSTELKTMVATFETWKAVHAVHGNAQHTSPTSMPVVCTLALFRWVRLTLPASYAFRTKCDALPTAVLRRVSPHSTASLSTIRRFAHELTEWTLRTIVHDWRADTRAKRLVVVTAQIRQRTQTLDRAFACLRAWSLHTQVQRCLRDKRAWVSQRRDRMTLRACLRWWRLRLRSAHRTRDATHAYNRHLLRQCVVEWRRSLALHRATVQFAVRAVTRTVVQRWRRFVSSQQGRTLAAHAAWRHRRRIVLTACWTTWQHCAEYERDVQRKLRGWRRQRATTTQRLVLQCWRLVALRSQEQRHSIALARRRHDKRQLRAAVSAWAMWSATMRAHGLLVRDAVARRQARLTATVFSSWQVHFATSQRSDAARTRRIRQSTKRRLWRVWVKATRVRHVAQCFMNAYEYHVTAVCFSAWDTLTQRQVRNADVVATLVSDRKTRVLEECWTALATNVGFKQTQRRSATKLESCKVTAVLSAGFARWRTFAYARVEQSRRAHTVAQRVVRRGRLSRTWMTWTAVFQANRSVHVANDVAEAWRRRRCFRSWQRLWNQSRLKRARVEDSKANLERFRVSRAVRYWKQHLGTTKTLVAYSVQCEKWWGTQCIERYWWTWRQAFATRVHQTHQVAAVRCRWQSLRVQSSFLTWKTLWRLRRDHRRLLARLRESSHEKALDAFFRAWKTRSAAQREHQHTLERLATELLCWKLQRAVACWRQYASSRRDLSRSFQSCRRRRLHAGLERSFQQWKQLHVGCVRLKTLSTHAAVHSKRHLLHTSVNAWRQWRHDQQRRRRDFQSLTVQLQQWRGSKALRTLHEATSRAKQIRHLRRAVACRCDRRATATSFVSWRRLVVAQKQRRNRYRKWSHQLQVLRLERCVRRWTRYTELHRRVHEALRRADTFARTASYQRAFQAWAHYKDRRHLDRTLTHEARGFHVVAVLAHYVERWQRFVRTSKRARSAMMRAAGLQSHQRQARAFRAWQLRVVDAQQMNVAVLRWQIQTQRRWFASWYRYRVDSSVRQRSVARADTFRARRTRIRVLEAWMCWVHNEQAVRTLWGRLRMLLARNVLHAWKQRTEYELEQAARIRSRLQTLRATELTAKCVDAWQRFVVRQRRIRGRRRQQQRSVRRQVLHAWQRVVASNQRLRRGTRVVSQQAATRIARTYWSRWQAYKRRCCAVNAALTWRRRVVLTRVLRGWREAARRSRRVTNSVRTKQQSLLTRVFHSGWRQLVMETRAAKSQVQQLRRTHETFLNEWLSHEVHARTATIVACEDVMRAHFAARLLARTWAAWAASHAHKRQQHVAIYDFQRRLSTVATLARGDRSSVGAALTRVLVRWRRLREAHVFDAWASATCRLRVDRTQTLVALEQWQAMQTRRCFSHWRTRVMRVRRQRAVATMGVANVLVRYWQRWSEFITTAHTKATATQHAVTWRTRYVLQRHVTTWRRLARRARVLHSIVTQLYVVSWNRLARAVVCVWKQFAVSTRTVRLQCTVALAMHRARTTRACWRTWRAFAETMTHHRQELQANTERLHVLLLCSTFRGWREWAAAKRRLATAARVLSAKHATRTASGVVRVWHWDAHTRAARRRHALALERVSTLQRGLRLLQCFVAQRQCVSAATERATLFAVAMRNQHVARSFTSWRQVAVSASKFRLAKRHFVTRTLLPTVWRAWRAFVQRKRVGASRIAQATLFSKHALLRRVWCALVRHHTRARQRTCDLLVAAEHWTASTRKRVIESWRRVAARASQLRAAGCGLVLQWRLRVAYRSVSRWQRLVVYTRETRQRQLAVTATSHALTVLRAWGVWRKLFVVKRTGQRRRLQRCWTLWCGFCANQNAQTSVQRAIEATVLVGMQKRMLQHWKQLVVVNKTQRATAMLSRTFAAAQATRRVFDSWRQAATRRRVDNDKIRTVLFCMRRHRQRTVLRCFRTHAMNQRRTRMALERASAQRVDRQKQQRFREWRHAVATAHHRRAMLARYVHKLQHSVQQTTLSSWREFARCRCERKRMVAQSLAVRAQLLSRVAWNAWVAFTATRKRTRHATLVGDTRRAKQSLHQWCRFVVLCKVEAMLGASKRRRCDVCVVAWRKKVALRRSVHAFECRVRQRQSYAQVRVCLRGWQHWSSVQRRVKQIVCGVANSSHVRFRFLRWKQLTSHRKRLKRMLLPSRGATGGVALSEPMTATNDDGSASPRGTASNEEELAALGAIAVTLARKARIFQRLKIEWNVATCWQRWRLAFHARLFYRLRTLHRHVSRWQSWSVKRRQVRQVLERFRERRIVLSLLTVVGSWRDAVRRLRVLQQQRLRDRERWTIVATEMARTERKCVKSHWKAWRVVVDEKRHLRTSLELYQSARLVTKYWLVWTHDYLVAVRRARQQAQHQTRLLMQFRQRRALQRLAVYHARSKRARLVLEYFANKRYDTTVPRVLAHWRARVATASCGRQFSTARLTRVLQRSFRAWRAWQRLQCELQTRAVAMAVRRRRTATTCVWRSWRAFVVREHGKHARLSAGLVHLVRSRLRRRWHQRVLDRKALESRCAHASTAIVRTRTLLAVRRWHSYSAASRLERQQQRFCLGKHLSLWRWSMKNEIAGRFARCLLRSRAKKVLVNWRRVAVQLGYWRQRCADILSEHSARRVRAHWTRWKQFITRRQRSHEAVIHFERQLCSRTLGALFTFVTTVNEQRELRAEQAEQHFGRRLRRSSWKTWQTTVQRQRQKRFSLLACMVKLSTLCDSRVLEVVWQSWRRWTRLVHQSRKLQLNVENKVLIKALLVWRQQVALKQRAEQQQAQAESYYVSRLTSVAFFYWQNYALAWKDITDANRQQTASSSFPRSLRPSRADRRDCEVRAPWPASVGGIEKADETNSSSVYDDGSDCKAPRVRPLSPVMKRLRQKNIVAARGEPERSSGFFTVSLQLLMPLGSDVMVFQRFKRILTFMTTLCASQRSQKQQSCRLV